MERRRGGRGGERNKRKKNDTQNKKNDYTWEVCAHVKLQVNKTWKTIKSNQIKSNKANTASNVISSQVSSNQK